MKTKRIFRGAKGVRIHCLVILSLVMFSSHLWASPLTMHGPLLKSIENRAPKEQSREIRVQIKEGTLCQALQDLEKKAQGYFKCPKSLDQIIVYSRTIRGSTWQSIVTQLLSDYNTIVLWKNEKELESIYLLGISSGYVAEETHAARAPQKDRGLLADISKLRTQWVNAPLSEELFNHPGFQKIFKTAQIKSPEDWMDQKKQRRVKRELRKLYKITQQKMKDSKE
jgi:hypothetical protein